MKTRSAPKATSFELVGYFMEAFCQDVNIEPTWPDFSTREIRL